MSYLESIRGLLNDKPQNPVYDETESPKSTELPNEVNEKNEVIRAEPLLTGDTLTDTLAAKLAAVPDIIREEIRDLLFWAGEPERTADELRTAGLPEDFEGVCRWVLDAPPMEVPRAMMRARAYPTFYRFANDDEGENQ